MARTLAARVTKIETDGTRGEVMTPGGEVFTFAGDDSFMLGDPVTIAVDKGKMVTNIVRSGAAYGVRRKQPGAQQPYWKGGKYR